MRLYREWLIIDLKSLPDDKKTLTTTDNPLVYEWKFKQIADRERLLSQLTTQERIVIERTICRGEKLASVSAGTGLTVREIAQVKEDAIEKLLYLRHGMGYRP